MVSYGVRDGVSSHIQKSELPSGKALSYSNIKVFAQVNGEILFDDVQWIIYMLLVEILIINPSTYTLYHRT
jgi:hypothetical protein